MAEATVSKAVQWGFESLVAHVEEVTVVYAINGTTKTETHTGETVRAQIRGSGVGILDVDDKQMLFRDCFVIRRKRVEE